MVSEGGKTINAGRTIKLAPWLVRDLREHVMSLPWRDGWLFPAVEGGHHQPGNWRRRVWKPCLRELGLDEQTRVHSLRHLHASMLIAEGRLLTEIAKRLGHANPGVTLTVYGHMIATDDSAAADAIPDFGATTARDSTLSG